MAKEDIESIEDNSKALCIPNNENLNWYSRLVSDCSGDVKEELLTNVLLPITNKGDKKYDSLSNVDYMHLSNSDQDLISYTRNTEVNKLCSIDRKQITAVYDTFTHKSKSFMKEIPERSYLENREQKKEISEELSVLRKKIIKQEDEITKYKNSLRKIKDCSFLKEWYAELVNIVKKDAKEQKGHILHKDVPMDIRREDLFVEKLQNQFTLEVVTRLLKEIVGDGRNEELLDCLKDIMMDQLVENSKLDYQSFVERVNTELREKINEFGNQFREIYELIINQMKPDKVIKAEQSVLDDMILEAVTQGKQDSALLLICNGADIGLERKGVEARKVLEPILEKPGFLVIRKLYSDMPSIKASLHFNLDVQTLNEFVVEGFSQLTGNFKECKIEDIFTLAEIRDALSDNTVVKEAADSLAECDKDKLIIKEQIMQKEKVLYELQRQFNSKKEEYTKPSWKWGALVPAVIFPWYSLGYAALFVGTCLAYTAVDVGRPWNARGNAKSELEIAQEDLDRAVKMFETFLEYLQCSVVAGSDIFNERCKKIEEEIANIKKNKEKWVNLSNVLAAFENAQRVSDVDKNKDALQNAQEVSSKSASCFNTESIKFGELAGDIISNRKRYMVKLSQPDQPNKNTGQAIVAKDKDNPEEEKKEALNETLVDIITRFQSGELSASELHNIKIELLVAGPSWKK
ncbi:MAG: hypothetical protein PG981_000910 [Wolbachia endosymbiont of Ctenocephalides orientis wCori]|nr:MAG: hypothetical protein PG981_000910 [Wolbachia endosymbiont of Ctenocephalides orientis wCori]